MPSPRTSELGGEGGWGGMTSITRSVIGIESTEAGRMSPYVAGAQARRSALRRSGRIPVRPQVAKLSPNHLLSLDIPRCIITTMTCDYDVLIVGAGPSAYTAAVYAARNNRKVLVCHGMGPSGQLSTTKVSAVSCTPSIGADHKARAGRGFWRDVAVTKSTLFNSIIRF